MSQIIFIYRTQDVIIPFVEHEPISSILQRFCMKVNAEKNNLCFLNNGTVLNEEITVDNILPNNQGKRIILVDEIKTQSTVGSCLKKSETIICPECQESIAISIKDYKISLFDCKNGHKRENILLSKFNETQNEDISKILCGICKKSKNQIYEYQMFICTDCKVNLCLMCKSIHDNTHNIIDYDKKKYICEKDGENFTAYCLTCKKNLCLSCEDDHSNHEIMPFSRLLKNKNELIKQNKDLRKDIDKFKTIINNITKKLNRVSENIETYFDINKMIINTSKRTYRNYEELFSINEFNNNTIQKDILSIVNDDNINNQFIGILEMYKKMGDEDEIQNNNENNIIENNNINNNNQIQNNNIINDNNIQIPIQNNNVNLNANINNNNNINSNIINNQMNQNLTNNQMNQNLINNQMNQNIINNEVNQNIINNVINQNVINNQTNQNNIINQNIINNNTINIDNNNKNEIKVDNTNNNNQNNQTNNNINNNNQNNQTTSNNNTINNNNLNQIQNSTTPVGNNNNCNNNTNDDIDFINNILNIELENELRQNIDKNTPLVSDALDTLTLLNDYRENLEYLNSVQIIANKYRSIRKIRRDGNCFYRGFIYRIFEYISMTKNSDLYEKFLKKIEETKDLAKKNTKISSLIDEFYNVFFGEFCSCYNSLTNLNISSRDYIDKLFHDNNKEKCNYLVLFIRYSIAEYLRENRLLYEAYIEGNFDNWIENEVELIDNEADQVQIMACVNLFEIGVKIEYLNKVKNEVIKYPEDKKDEDIFITFLYTPGHYDLLYDK